MRLKCLVFVIMFFISVPVFAQTVDTAWVRIYNEAAIGPARPTDIVVGDNGNIYVTGLAKAATANYDYATIKYFPNGDTAWVRIYNGPANEDDLGEALAVDVEGNVYVTGESFNTSLDCDIITIKYAPDGYQSWVRSWNGLGDSVDYASDIVVDSWSNVYVCGCVWNGNDFDYVAIKYYENGDTAWVRIYDGPESAYDGANAIFVDDSGNVYITGQSYNGGFPDYATIKFDSEGNQLWISRYNGTGNKYDNSYAIVVDNSDNVYITGISYDSVTIWDCATIKYFPNGDTAWVRRYGRMDRPDIDRPTLAIDDSGNVYVAGSFYWGPGQYCDLTIKYYPMAIPLG